MRTPRPRTQRVSTRSSPEERLPLAAVRRHARFDALSANKNVLVEVLREFASLRVSKKHRVAECKRRRVRHRQWRLHLASALEWQQRHARWEPRKGQSIRSRFARRDEAAAVAGDHAGRRSTNHLQRETRRGLEREALVVIEQMAVEKARPGGDFG